MGKVAFNGYNPESPGLYRREIVLIRQLQRRGCSR